MQTTNAVTIRVPGRVYRDYLDPLTSSVATELGLPSPRVERRGRGRTFVYEEVPDATATELAEYLSERAFSLLGQDEDGAAHRGAVDVATKIRKALQGC